MVGVVLVSDRMRLKREMRLSSQQRQVLRVLNSFKPLADNKQGWKSARLFNPCTVRSLIIRGLVEPSSQVPWMLKYQLDDLVIRITTTGTKSIEETKLTPNNHTRVNASPAG